MKLLCVINLVLLTLISGCSNFKYKVGITPKDSPTFLLHPCVEDLDKVLKASEIKLTMSCTF